ncbi:MAG: hypothetical protein RIR25_732 [Verrucomicrobiota bacterium]
MSQTGLLLPRTADELRERLRDAASTLSRVPSPKHSRPSDAMGGAWPAVVQEFFDAYGYHNATTPRLRSTAAQISRMAEVLDWIALHWPVSVVERAGLPGDAGKIAWLRAAGWRYERIADWRRRAAAAGSARKVGGGPSGLAGGNTRRSLFTIEHRAIGHMLARLSGRTAVAQFESPAPETLDEPLTAFGVVVDFSVQERVAMVRAGGTLVPHVLTRHASAAFREIPRSRR